MKQIMKRNPMVPYLGSDQQGFDNISAYYTYDPLKFKIIGE